MGNSSFFELIQISVGSRDSLSCVPDAEEWKSLFVMSCKQALTGVCYYGVQRLDCAQTAALPPKVKARWLAMSASIMSRNARLNERCARLQEMLRSDGMNSSILKGQGIAPLYGPQLCQLRQCGDIDIWSDAERSKAIAWARSHGDPNPKWDYKHLHLNIFEDAEVELHYVPEISTNLLRNRRLQNWFAAHRSDMLQRRGELVCPSTEFNLFYILLHAYRHFMSEGVGLRQLMDYYFVLLASDKCERDNALAVVREMGMSRFAAGVMWIMREVFALDECKLLCPPDEREGRYLLDEIMQCGNFGHYDKRYKSVLKGRYASVSHHLRHSLHLVWRYPSEAFWAPVWVLWHWLWKRMKILGGRC